ncbi:MAG: hypothetical protein ABFS34_07755 [Gemmatimonadota bacterium]
MPQIPSDLVTVVYPVGGILAGIGMFMFFFLWTTIAVRRQGARVRNPFRTVLRHAILGTIVGLLVAIDSWSLLGPLRWPVAIAVVGIAALATFSALGKHLWSPPKKRPPGAQ